MAGHQYYGGMPYASPYLGMSAYGGAAPVMGWPAQQQPAQQHALLQDGHASGAVQPGMLPGNAAALLGLEWALEEADFASARLTTPHAGGGGLFGGAAGAAQFSALLGGGVHGGPSSSALVGAPLPPPQAYEVPPGGQRMRCLDPSHAAPCPRCARGAPAAFRPQKHSKPWPDARTPRATRFPLARRSCTPAPPREAVAFYNLVGDPGRKNGEKKLKHQILRTAEWASPHARAQLVRLRSPFFAATRMHATRARSAPPFALPPAPHTHAPTPASSQAASCERDGFPALARVLRGDATSAALRKADFLHLTRVWGYASDVWCVEGTA
jgi:hypothetical protein